MLESAADSSVRSLASDTNQVPCSCRSRLTTRPPRQPTTAPAPPAGRTRATMLVHPKQPLGPRTVQHSRGPRCVNGRVRQTRVLARTQQADGPRSIESSSPKSTHDHCRSARPAAARGPRRRVAPSVTEQQSRQPWPEYSFRREAGGSGRRHARPLSSLAGRGAHDRKGDGAATPRRRGRVTRAVPGQLPACADPGHQRTIGLLCTVKSCGPRRRCSVCSLRSGGRTAERSWSLAKEPSAESAACRRPKCSRSSPLMFGRGCDGESV
jgi:hypothetical protein